ncbi:hypothetical protein [Clostridium sp. C8-1-8]|uniref:hypothetical protein n=1 Tax=Clostridium sp. C8-1-8 TaxID=2698831 RepID=UPI00136903C6|nr:hypothetical protein [Clostridium sp. C8-1-8]
MKKIFKIILIIIILSITGLLIFFANKFNFQIINAKKTLEYTLPNDTRVIDILDKNNFYIQKKNDNCIYLYNLKTKIFSPIIKPVNNGEIVDARFSNHWSIWTQFHNGLYTIYSQYKSTTHINEINGAKAENQPVISLDNDYLVYSVTDKEKSSIILFNLNDKKSITLDSKSKNDKDIFSQPDISNNLIVWSKSKNVNNSIYSNVYCYNIRENKKDLLSENLPILKPKIDNNIIVATKVKSNTEYTESCISIYDFNKKSWSDLIDENSEIYHGMKNVSIDDPLISSKYITWWDNYSSKIYLYDIKNCKVLDISSDKTSDLINQAYLMRDNLIFYRSVNKNNELSHKCLIINY